MVRDGSAVTFPATLWLTPVSVHRFADSPENDHSFSSETDHFKHPVISEVGAKRRWLFDCDRD
jgi:hypothetical protein